MVFVQLDKTMKKLKDLFKESNYLKYKEYALQKHEGVDDDQRTAFLEAVKLYKEFANVVYKKDGLKEVYENIRHIVDVAGKMTIDETEQWFDGVTVSRHMKRMNESFKLFEKTLKEMYPLQQRLESTYDEIGEVLGKYYEINELEEGNEFGAARAKAIAAGEDEFEVDGKTFPVKSVGKDDKANAKKFAKESVNKSTKLTDILKKSVNEASGDFGGWIAFYNNKKLEIDKSEAKDLWAAKQLAIKKLKVPKSKTGLLAIQPAVEESVNESNEREKRIKNLTISQYEDAIKMFQDKIKRQGMVTNARDEEHLARLKKMYKKMGGKLESVNESTKLTDILKKKVKSVNEAKAIPVPLQSSDFTDSTSMWGFYQKGKTWRVHSNYFVDMHKENNPDERDVVFLEAAVWSGGKVLVGIGGINNLKRTNASTFGKTFQIKPGDDIDKASKEASKFLFDKDHFKWVNKSIKAEGKPLRIKPKGDFSTVIKTLLSKLDIKEQSVNEAKYDIGMAMKGSGITVYNRAEEEAGDYKNVAHIKPNGMVTYYDKKLPKDIKDMIEKKAQSMK